MKEIFTITIELDLYHTEFFICRMSEKEVKNTNQHFESKIHCGMYTDVREKNLACLTLFSEIRSLCF